MKKILQYFVEHFVRMVKNIAHIFLCQNFSRRLCYGGILFCLASFIFCPVDSALADKSGLSVGKLAQATVVWSEERASAYELFYSWFKDGSWSEAKQLTNNGLINYVPTLVEDRHGDTWVVWSAGNHSEVQLYFAVIRNGIILLQPEKIDTKMTSNVGPYLEVANAGDPVLVWAGNNSNNDDIYYSEWNGNKWSKPLRVNSPNNTPDYLPKILVDPQGGVSVEWRSFGAEGPVVKTRDIQSDIMHKVLRKKGTQTSALRRLKKQRTQNCIDKLPAQIQNIDRSSIVFTCDGEDLPQQVRYLGDFIRDEK